MTDTKHTPEPWICDDRIGCIAIYQGNHKVNCLSGYSKYVIAYKHGYNDDAGWHVDEVDVANYRRIVACVNACAGMDDPEAEIARLRQTIAELVDLIESIPAPPGWSLERRANAGCAIAKAREALK